MTKEEILEELKSLVLSLTDGVEAIKQNPNFASDFSERQKRIGEEVNKLNSCDASWLNDEYGAWIKETVKSQIDKLNPELKGKMDWL